MKDVIDALIAPRAAVTFGTRKDFSAHQLFIKHQRIFGKIAFLQRFGSKRKIDALIADHFILLKQTLDLIPEQKNRSQIALSVKATVRPLRRLAKTASDCEKQLAKVHLRFDDETGRVCELLKDNNKHHPKQFYSMLVEEAFEYFRPTLGTSNSRELREAIARSLAPIFEESLLSLGTKSKLSRTIDNCVRNAK